MTIFVLIPVFNRLHHTQRVIEALRNQTLADTLRIVVINDGSTDGTVEYLQLQKDVVALQGNGNLWWGGAIQKGLDYVGEHGKDADYVLFLNNDTWFSPDYVEALVRVSQEADGAAVGSVIHEEGRDPPIVSIGPKININRLAVWDLLNQLPPEEQRHPRKTYRVDTLSGRGTLYPAVLFRRYGGMHTWLLPHYMADYEIAMRFGRAGVPLLVSTEAVVFSPQVYGNNVSKLSWWQRHFSIRSSSNIAHKLVFYLLIGSPAQRITAPLRMLCFGIWRAFSR